MQTELPDWNVEEYRRLPSTQDELKGRLRAGTAVNGLVIRAQRQEAGRGQRSRDWLSGTGGSWQSAAVRVPLRPAATLFIGIHVTDALNTRLNGAPLRLKWPNDIMLDGRKTAGILCEYVDGHLLTGIGVNVRNDIPAGAARLDTIPLGDVHGSVLAGIRAGLQALLTSPESLQEDFARLDAQRGRQLTIGRHRGTADGVTPDGRLRLQTPAGLQLLSSLSEPQAP
ncbi:MAG TPA: biotin--[acetyl-CoA-carboxylase] ligase [Deinococcales bacterium]|nr:biotin--[acetyl-CoA-carboxylase] ligase [Deinococcales bacterium]